MNAIVPIREGAQALVEDIAVDLQSALPANIPFDRFKATFITAVAHNPEILSCDPQSVKTALMKAAIDNLMPDSREAAIVPFNTKVKGDDGREKYVKLAQYMPMVQGIRKRALELGGARITAEAVFENDHFDAVLGDDPHLEHKPAKLGTPRGEIVGAYAIFKDESGTIIHREVMPKEDIESARKVSRAKDGPGWSNFYSEFARKTVVRRGSKSVPNIPERLRTIIERDDDYVDFEQADTARKTIDHNPLLDTKAVEHKPSAPMETIDTSTGEIIETSPSSSKVEPAPHKGSGAGSSPAADTTNSPDTSRSSSPAAGDSVSGDDEGSSSLPSLTRDAATKIHLAMARINAATTDEEAEKKLRANARDVMEKNGYAAKSEKDKKYLADILKAHVDRVMKRVPDATTLSEVQGWIDQDYPEGGL